MKNVIFAIGIFSILFASEAFALGLQPISNFDNYWTMETYSANDSVSYTFKGPNAKIESIGSEGNVVQHSIETSIGITARINIEEADNTGVVYISDWHIGSKNGNRIGAQLIIIKDQIKFRVFDFDDRTTITEAYYQNIVGQNIYLGLARQGSYVYYYIEGYGILQYMLDNSIVNTGVVSTGFGVSADETDKVNASFSQISHVTD